MSRRLVFPVLLALLYEDCPPPAPPLDASGVDQAPPDASAPRRCGQDVDCYPPASARCVGGFCVFNP